MINKNVEMSMKIYLGNDGSYSSNLSWAHKYANLGWQVFPVYQIEEGICSCPLGKNCKSPGKHPRTKTGLKEATTNKETIDTWWKGWPHANIGIRTGPESGIFVLDVDINHDKGKYGDNSLDELLTMFNVPEPDTVEAITGGGGRHLFFKYPPGQVIKSGTNVIGDHLDIRANGGYVVAEPSNHISGGNYTWEGSSDPLAGATVIDAPDWLLQSIGAIQEAAHAVVYREPVSPGLGTLFPEELEEIQSALRFIDNDDRTRWVEVGMAIHSIDDAQPGFDLWSQWSESSKKYDAKDQMRVWSSFAGRVTNGGPQRTLNRQSIFYWAQNSGWINPMSAPLNAPEEKPGEAAEILATTVATQDLKNIEQVSSDNYPDVLLTPPGIIKSITKWANATAPKPQPHLAIQASIAAVSTVLGRRFRTDKNNWPSLFFINIAPSGEGKEHSKKIIEKVLGSVGDKARVAGAGYTSATGVYTALTHAPAHVTIIDEIGRDLQTTNATTNSHKYEALTMIMESFGRCDGEMRPKNYANTHLSLEDQRKAVERRVHNPAITLMGMSTPDSFYGGLSSKSISDGFLNRFLIVNSPLGRQSMRFDQADDSLPEDVIAWGEKIKGRVFSQGDMIETNEMCGEEKASPIVIPIPGDVLELFEALDRRSMAERQRLDGDKGLSDLLTRTVEKAMRLSLVCQLAIDPLSEAITKKAAEYAIQYVEWCDNQLVKSARTHIHDNKFSKAKTKIVDFIKRQEKGAQVSRSQISKRVRAYMDLRKLERVDVLSTLVEDGSIIQIEKVGNNGHRSYVYAIEK
jgi:hypothetical protein